MFATSSIVSSESIGTEITSRSGTSETGSSAGRVDAEEAEEAGEELADDPHYYKKLSHLFMLDQVERTEDRQQAKQAAPEAAPAALDEDDDNQMLMRL